MSTQSIQFKFEYTPKNSISSINNLLNCLDITQKELDKARSMPCDKRYKSPKNSIQKSNGTERQAFNPHQLIRKIQSRIVNRIFNNKNNRLKPTIHYPYYIFGSIPNQIDCNGNEESRDYIACAKKHCLAKSILKLDIENYFDNISEDLVFEIFKKFFKFPDEVANCLSDLCCREGKVPQGALTSSYIATLCLFEKEPDLVKRLKKKGLIYTRLVDDITVSSKDVNFNFDLPKQIILETLRNYDLPVNFEKTKIIRFTNQSLVVHGLRISFKEPRLQKTELSRIRASVKNLELAAKDLKYRTSIDYRHDFNKCMGRVNKLKRLGHSQHSKLVDRLLKIKPLPSFKEVYLIDEMISDLEKYYINNNSKFSYYKWYYKTLNRIIILKRRFPKQETIFRRRLKQIQPGNSKK